MNFNFSEDEAKKLLNESFDIACDVSEFISEILFQNENHKALQSRNARDIAYRLGRTEERFSGSICLYNKIVNIASRVIGSNCTDDAPIMQMAYRREYSACSNCYRPISISISWQNSFWQLPFPSAKCSDCESLAYLTDRILLFAAIQKALEKGAEIAKPKIINFLAGQYGNSSDEIRRIYYVEQNQYNKTWS